MELNGGYPPEWGLFNMTTALIRVSVAVRKHHDQTQLEERAVCFIFLLKVHCPEESGREPKGRNGHRGQSEMLLTALLLNGLLSLSSYITQDQPAQEWHFPQGEGPSTSIISQESAPQACLQANLLGTFLQLSFSLPK